MTVPTKAEIKPPEIITHLSDAGRVAQLG